MITDQNMKAVLILRDDFNMSKDEIIDNFAERGITIFKSDIPSKAKNYCVKAAIHFRGEERSIKEWSRITGIPYKTIKGRLYRGWTVERALTKGRRFNGSRRHRNDI